MLERLTPQLTKLGRRLLRVRAVRVLWRAMGAYDKDGCLYMAAALSFYAMLSLIPLTFVGLWALTRIVGSSAEAQEQLEDLLRQHLLPQVAHDLIQRVNEIADAGVLSILGTWWSVLAFLWAGVSFYESLHSTLSTAWGGQQIRPFFQRKLLTLTAFVVAGLFFVMTMYLTATLAAIDNLNHRILGVSMHWFWGGLARVLPFAFSIAMFFLLYKFMPNAFVPWRLALATAIPVGFLWELGKRLFTIYIAERGTYASIYGPMAGFVLLMVWVYYSSTLILFGAEVGAAWQREIEERSGGVNDVNRAVEISPSDDG
jgi:membrane protein